MAIKTFLAVDLGASSGRILAGKLSGDRIALEEIHRFVNGPVHVCGHMHWDVLRLWQEIQDGMRKATELLGHSAVSIGVDTWGVDFALLGPGDELLGNPYHYRDARTDGILDRAFAVLPRGEIFAHSGLQFMPFNTLYQLWSMRRAGSPLLDVAERMLMMPDLFHWLLSGERSNESTNASTTQLLNPRTGTWSDELCEAFQIPRGILGAVSTPGTSLGPLLPRVAEETCLGPIQVVLPGTHDTASAVMAVPAMASRAPVPTWCYISSGTWSLMGVEISRPIVSEKCLALNFTNEGGVGGTTRLLKNVSGLWLIQECRRAWSRSGAEYSWERLIAEAAASPALVSLIEPDHGSFLAPQHMPDAIAEYCRRTGQQVPASEGATIRCALESLALKYRRVLSWLEELVGGRIETVHIVGGGAQNRLLSQMTADACQRQVVTGPVEATAMGNAMVQAVAAGEVADIAQARTMIRRSFPTEEYLPREGARWEEAYERFLNLEPA